MPCSTINHGPTTCELNFELETDNWELRYCVLVAGNAGICSFVSRGNFSSRIAR